MNGFAGVVRFGGGARAGRDLERLCRSFGVHVGDTRRCSGDDVFSFVAQTPCGRGPDGRIALCDGRVGDGGHEGAASDAHRLLDAWLRRGSEVSDLPGSFTAALWSAERTLRLINTPASYRTLYYFRSSRCVVFATELRPILAFPDVPHDIDEIGLADLLAVNRGTSDRTVWSGIRRVPGGCTAVIDATGVRIERWWDIRNAPEVRYRRDDDYVEAARDLFERALSACANRSKPLVAAVSGGLDSAPIAATLARSGQTVHTLTLVAPSATSHSEKPWRYVDDRPYIAALKSRWPRITGELIEQSTPDAFEMDANGAFFVTQTPVVQPSALAWLLPLHRRAAALGADTVLTGGLGDATFSYDGRNLLADCLRQGRVLKFATELRGLHDGPGAKVAIARGALSQAFEPLPLRRWRYRSKPGGVGDWPYYAGVNADFAAATNLRARLVANDFPRGGVLDYGGARAGIEYATMRDRFSAELTSCLRTMTGVMMETPYADRRVLEFCAGLPMDQFMRRGQERWLARRMFADRLPPTIVRNLLKGEQRTNWFDLLTQRRQAALEQIEAFGRSSLASRVLDVPRLRRLAEDWPRDVAEAHRRHVEYRGLLTRALHVGQFLRWADPANASR